MSPYLKSFKKVLVSLSLKNELYPSDLIDAWSAFVSQCEKGYYYTIFEYEYEIRIRQDIELILNADILKVFDDFQY